MIQISEQKDPTTGRVVAKLYRDERGGEIVLSKGIRLWKWSASWSTPSGFPAPNSVVTETEMGGSRKPSEALTAGVRALARMRGEPLPKLGAPTRTERGDRDVADTSANEILSISCTATEKRKFLIAALKADKSLSAWARGVLLPATEALP